jgi:hypothetical protein
VRDGTTGGADRCAGLGFTTVGEPAKQLPGSRVVRVSNQLGLEPGAVDPMTGHVSQFEFPLAIACKPGPVRHLGPTTDRWPGRLAHPRTSTDGPTLAARIWLITGVSSGFGRELSTKLLDHGDHVVGTNRDLSKVTDLATCWTELTVPQ